MGSILWTSSSNAAVFKNNVIKNCEALTTGTFMLGPNGKGFSIEGGSMTNNKALKGSVVHTYELSSAADITVKDVTITSPGAEKIGAMKYSNERDGAGGLYFAATKSTTVVDDTCSNFASLYGTYEKLTFVNPSAEGSGPVAYWSTDNSANGVCSLSTMCKDCTVTGATAAGFGGAVASLASRFDISPTVATTIKPDVKYDLKFMAVDVFGQTLGGNPQGLTVFLKDVTQTGVTVTGMTEVIAGAFETNVVTIPEVVFKAKPGTKVPATFYSLPRPRRSRSSSPSRRASRAALGTTPRPPAS